MVVDVPAMRVAVLPTAAGLSSFFYSAADAEEVVDLAVAATAAALSGSCSSSAAVVAEADSATALAADADANIASRSRLGSGCHPAQKARELSFGSSLFLFL